MTTGLDARAAYELWADAYPPVAHNPVMRAEQSIVEPMLLRARSARALDVGTGSGRYLPVLRAAGARTVIGIDFSERMLRSAPSFRRVRADARELPFRKGAFDLVNASLMVGDITDLRAWMSEIARVLALGGQLVYSDFHPVWAENGWRRTFRTAAGAEHEVAIAHHTIEEHLEALEAAGLTHVAVREPRLKDADDPAIRSFRKRWSDPPVVVVFHAVKQP